MTWEQVEVNAAGEWEDAGRLDVNGVGGCGAHPANERWVSGDTSALRWPPPPLASCTAALLLWWY
jgi:hypothetical protein